MKGILLRLACLFAGACAILYGVDGMRINGVPKTLTIEEIERHGTGGARYINVVGGQSDGSYVVRETMNDKTVMDVIYPVFSQERLASASAKTMPPVSLVFKAEHDTGCRKDTQCGKVGPVLVSGVVQGGPVWWLGRVTENSLESIRYPMAEHFVFVDEGPPSPAPVYLIVILVGAILLTLGFLRKESFGRYVLGRR